MPLPPPVMSTTFPSSLMQTLDPFEVALALPVCHRRVVRGLLGLVEVAVMLDDLVAKGLAGEATRRKALDGRLQRVRHARQIARRIDVPLEARRRLGTRPDAVEAGGQSRCEREV